MSTYEKRIKTLMEYLKDSDDKIHDLQVKYEKEKNHSKIVDKQLKEHISKINILNDNINELEENLYNQNIELDKEKCNCKILTKQLKDYTLEIKILKDRINDDENILLEEKIKYNELLKKYEEHRILNIELQNNLKMNEDNESKMQLHILYLEKELEKLNNQLIIINNENQIKIKPIEHIINVEPINTLSLYDEIELSKNDSKKDDIILEYNEKMKKINIYMWFYRCISFISFIILIYCIYELFYVNN
jgi:hypothetical protein